MIELKSAQGQGRAREPLTKDSVSEEALVTVFYIVHNSKYQKEEIVSWVPSSTESKQH